MKKLLPEMIDDTDMVIPTAEEPFVPEFLRNNKKVVWWEIENPPFATREVSEKIYGEIRSLVERILLGPV